MSTQPFLHIHLKEPVSVLFFIIDMGPVLLLSFTFVSLLFFSWYFGVKQMEQRKKLRLWLVQNEATITNYKTLKHILKEFGETTTCCKKCKNNKMQFWDYKEQEFLVVRCRSCKINYTYTKEHNELTKLILTHINEVETFVGKLVTNRYDVFCKRLLHTLAINLNGVKESASPLEVIHFTSSKKENITPKHIKDIFLQEWEVVFPDRSERLVS